MISLLAKLAAHPQFAPWGETSEVQFQSMAVDIVNDLAEFSLIEIESGIIGYRNNPRSKGFPSPGMLKELCQRARTARQEASRPSLKATVHAARPICWWMKSRRLWRPEWREDEVPSGEKVRDPVTDRLRDPERVVF